VDLEVDRQALAAHPLDEVVERGEAGLRRERRLVRVAGLEHVEQRADLSERLTARLLDRLEGPGRAGLVGGGEPAGGGGLDGHGAERVGDDVVQLARDAGALVQRGLLGAGAALELGVRGLLVQCAAEVDAVVQQAAGQQRTGDEQHDGADVVREARLVGRARRRRDGDDGAEHGDADPEREPPSRLMGRERVGDEQPGEEDALQPVLHGFLQEVDGGDAGDGGDDGGQRRPPPQRQPGRHERGRAGHGQAGAERCVDEQSLDERLGEQQQSEGQVQAVRRQRPCARTQVLKAY